MDRFEYEITRYSAETFGRMIYFCNQQGDCGIQSVPDDEPQALVDIMNQRGLEGWELVQLLFGRDGAMACWKRKLRAAAEYDVQATET